MEIMSVSGIVDHQFHGSFHAMPNVSQEGVSAEQIHTKSLTGDVMYTN